jgi:hemolysin activation/secretion protein
MLASARAIAAALAMASVSFAAVAQVVPPGAQIVPPSDQPGRERERFERPPAPLAQPGAPAIGVPGIEAPPGAAETKLVIRQIRVVGSTVYTPAQLAELYADLLGKTVTLQAVYDLAQRITTKYGGDGYVLSRAIVPVQELDPNGAVVTIQVVEGYIETVEWPPQLSAYRDFFSYYASRISAERPVNIRTIERYLLLAGDLPGLRFKNSIKPHPTKVGAAILVVEVTQKPVDFFGRVDNRGTPARGPLQYLSNTTFNNLFGGHEALTLTAAGAFKTRELQYYAANYRQALNGEGLTYFATASYGFGHPGTEELELLNYRTRSFYAETGLSYPVIRARERNLNVSGLWFWSNDRGIFFDLPDEPPSTHDRMRGMRVRVEADSADQVGGINQLYFVFSQGVRGLGATQNGQDLASRLNGRVDFSKMELTLSRLWPLPLLAGSSGLVAIYGQYAMTPLLVSELCGYGGRLFGRGFDPSQFVSDSCIEALFELRYDIPVQLPALTLTQLYGFFDKGWLHNLAPVPGTFQSVDAASFGAGLRLGWLNAVTADLTVTQVAQGQGLLGTTAVPPGILSTAPRKNTRFFFVLSARL